MSENIKTFLTKDHRACDEEFANMENAVASDNWVEAKKKFDSFVEDLYGHFDMEEKVMFPAFESRTGMMGGPTQVMRMEHDQMRNVISQMENDVTNKNKDHFFGLSESLKMLMQQHNMKEEQMLYAMADAHLGVDAFDIVEKMKELKS